MFSFLLRQGIGLNIAYSEDKIYRCVLTYSDASREEVLLAFKGATISLPFCEVLWGDFSSVTDYKKVNNE